MRFFIALTSAIVLLLVSTPTILAQPGGFGPGRGQDGGGPGPGGPGWDQRARCQRFQQERNQRIGVGPVRAHGVTQLGTAFFEAAETNQRRVVAMRGIGGVYGKASGLEWARWGRRVRSGLRGGSGYDPSAQAELEVPIEGACHRTLG